MSSTEPRGLLYVEMECPPELEEEFHAWYNTEHVPERMSTPGFVRARRYAALVGAPRWLAIYELTSTSVLLTPEYMRWWGDAQTAWTKRILSAVHVYRGVYDLAWSSGQAAEGVNPSGGGLLAVRYEVLPEEVDRVAGWHDEEFAPLLLQLPGVLWARRYRCANPGMELESLALFELRDPWVSQDREFSKVWAESWAGIRASLLTLKKALYVQTLAVG